MKTDVELETERGGTGWIREKEREQCSFLEKKCQ